MPFSKEKLTARLLHPVSLALLAFMLTLPLLFLLKIPQSDCASRYAPMAEAFAAAQWKFAFHPRTPPLHPVAAGLVATVFHTDGFTAAKLASALFFALGILPFYGIFRRVFDQRTALTGAVLYIFCGPWLELAYSGLRDSAKGFFLLLAIYGVIYVFQRREKWYGYLWAAIGSAGLALTRGDCLLYALLMLSTVFLMELWHNHRVYIPFRSLAGIVLFAVLIMPWVHYQYRMTGYPVTDVQQTSVLMRIEDRLGAALFRNSTRSSELQHAPGVRTKTDPPPVNDLRTFIKTPQRPITQTAQPKKHLLSEFIESLFDGFYPPFALLALPVIVYRIRKKKWTAPETLLLTLLLFHTVLQVSQIALANHILFVSSRYLISAAPLLFGWTAIGLIMVYPASCRLLMRRRLRPAIIAAALLICLYLHAGSRVIKSFTSERTRSQKYSILSSAAWIRSHYPLCGEYDISVPLKPRLYHSGRKPCILSSEPAVGLFTQGHVTNLDLLGGDLGLFCKKNKVEFLVLYRREAESLGLDETKAVFASGDGRYSMLVFDLHHKTSDEGTP